MAELRFLMDSVTISLTGIGVVELTSPTSKELSLYAALVFPLQAASLSLWWKGLAALASLEEQNRYKRLFK